MADKELQISSRGRDLGFRQLVHELVKLLFIRHHFLCSLSSDEPWRIVLCRWESVQAIFARLDRPACFLGRTLARGYFRVAYGSLQPHTIIHLLPAAPMVLLPAIQRAMLYQSGRLLCWLEQYADAIQAVSAMLTLIVSIILGWFAIVSARAAQDALQVSRRQLDAQLTPKIVMRWSEIDYEAGVSVYTLKNVGSDLVEWRRLELWVYWARVSADPYVEISTLQNWPRVISPGEEISEECRFSEVVSGLRERFGAIIENQRPGIRLCLDCTDVSGSSKHSFSLNQKGEFDHYPAFMKDRSRYVL